jgi:hypothetical protein
MSEPVWLNDPTILLKHNKLNKLWPSQEMTPEEKVNSITRLVIILTILGYMLTLSLKLLLVGIITLTIIVLIYILQSRVQKNDKNGNDKNGKNGKNGKKESFVNSNTGYTDNLSEVYPAFTDPKTYELVKEQLNKPTPENPTMNVLLPEIHYNPNRKGGAPAFNQTVETDINKAVKQFISKSFKDKNIHKKLFSNIGDDMMFDGSMRQWYTTANTTIPNDQNGFAQFAYGTMLSGKEGNKMALERNQSGAYNYTMY